MAEQLISSVKLERITALVLAAGYSSRMGDFKPLMKFGERTLLERVISLFSGVGITDIRVIIGHRGHDLMPYLEKQHITWTRNEKYQEGMMSSVKAGLVNIKAGKDAFFVTPVDVPLVRRHTIQQLIRAFHESDNLICFPNFLGKRGHPPLISTQYRNEILQWDKPGGLRAFLKQKQVCALDVNVTDQGILLDMDTPEDYQRLLQIYKEAESILLHNACRFGT